MRAAAQLELPLNYTATSSHPEVVGSDQDGEEASRLAFDPLSPRTASARHMATTPTFVVEEAIERRRTYRQIISHHWECTVDRLGADSFTATLRSLRSPDDSEKEAEIPVAEVSDDDLELLAPGAVFYWTIGYEVTPSGTRRRFSQIKFRRLPAWTRKDIRRVEAKADALFQLFGSGDARAKTGQR